MTIITATQAQNETGYRAATETRTGGEMNTELISPSAAAFSRIVMEGMHGQAVRQACDAGLSVGEVRLAASLHREVE